MPVKQFRNRFLGPVGPAKWSGWFNGEPEGGEANGYEYEHRTLYTEEEYNDKVEGLTADLEMAVLTAYKRGATEWTRLNYPDWYSHWNEDPPA